MKKRSLKLLSVLLTCVMIMGVFPLLPSSVNLAKAADGVTATGSLGDNVTWTLSEDGLLTVSGTGATADYTLPEGGMYSSENPVDFCRDITPLSPYLEEITSVKVEEGITALGSAVFAGLLFAKSITLPDSLVSIGDGAFAYCVSLDELVLPSNVREIGDDILSEVMILPRLVLPEFYEAPLFVGGDCNIMELTIPAGVEAVEVYAAAIQTLYNRSKTAVVTIDLQDDPTASPRYLLYYRYFYIEMMRLFCETSEPTGEQEDQLYINAAYLAFGLTLTKEESESLFMECMDEKGQATVYCYDESAQHDSCMVRRIRHILFETGELHECFDEFDPVLLREGFCGDPDDGMDGHSVAWSLDENDVLTISGSGPMGSTPNAGDLRVKELIVEPGVTSLPDGAFKQCENMASVSLPETLVSIGSECFADTGMTSLILPDSLNSMGISAFENCDFLTQVQIGAGLTELPEQAFDNTKLSAVHIPGTVKTIAPAAFLSCSELQSVQIDEGVERVHLSAFNGCQLLRELRFPESLLVFADFGNHHYGTDRNYVALETVYFGKNASDLTGISVFPAHVSVTVSEENPYYSMYDKILYNKDYTELIAVQKGVTSVTLPKEMQSDITFNFDNDLQEINVEPGNLRYASYDGVLYTADMKKAIFCPRGRTGTVTIPEGVETIGRDVFESHSGITAVSLPQSLRLIERDAFAFNSALTQINLPNELEVIEDGAFQYTAVSGEFTIPAGCRIYVNAFNNSAVTGLHFGAGATVDRLGFYANATCDLPLLTTLSTAENDAFLRAENGCLFDLVTGDLLLTVVGATVSLPDDFPRYSDMKWNYCFPWIGAFACSAECENYSVFDGLLYNKDMTELIACPRYRTDDVTVAESTLDVAEYAFVETSFAHITLPEGLRTLGSFRQSALEEITIPSTVSQLLDSQFDNCHNLRSVSILSPVKEIPDHCFFSTALTSLPLPDTVERIGNSALHYGIDFVCPPLLRSIGDSNQVHSIVFNDKLERIGDYFSVSVDNVTFPESLQYIGSFYVEGTVEFKSPYTVIDKPENIIRGTLCGECGSTVHEVSIKRNLRFVSRRHTWLNWYVSTPATFESEGVEKRMCALCGEAERRAIPKLERTTFTATFMADGRVVGCVDFQKDAVTLEEPPVPGKDRYLGEWEPYTLQNADLTINARYTLIKSDDASQVAAESSAVLYYDTDNVLFRMSAFSEDQTVQSVVANSTPLDIVLVVDQSGSMGDTLGGSVTKLDALKNAAHEFIGEVADNAALTGAAHRISIVGFGLSGPHSGYTNNENTELLTSARGVVAYDDITPADYASSLISIRDRSVLDAAVDAIEARGATAADLGLQMAKEVFSRTDSEGRDRVVVFMTDGAPTYSSDFQTSVANSAVANAKLLKDANTFGALVYSVGIFSEADAANSRIRNFMQAVSSNCPNAETIDKRGTVEADSFFITADNTDALTDVFGTITEESTSHTASFDQVTLIKTLSKYVTLTGPQEQMLRVDTIRRYGISNDQISVTRNGDGTTVIRIDGLTPYETEKDGKQGFEVKLEFFASLNENAAVAAEYPVDGEDSGVMLGGAVGYEAVFATNQIELSADKTRYLFRINGEIYEIAEGSSVSAVVPETDFSPDWDFSGWNTEGVANDNGLILDATLVKAPRTVIWHTAEGDITHAYLEGQFLTVPDVPDRADGSKFLSWDQSLPTVMPDRNLEFTAVYGEHVHVYVSEDEIPVTCTEDGLRRYTCVCGDSYTETLTATGHSFEAVTPSTKHNASRCTFVCSGCGARYEYALAYRIYEIKNKGKTIRYDFNLTDDDLNVGFEPDGRVVITIPLSEFQNQAANAVVYRTVDGVREPVPYDIRDGFLVIYADHFTPYDIDLVFPCEIDGSHDWDEGSLTKPATCTEPGELTYICSICSGIKTEPVPAAHTLSFVSEQAASAEAEGIAAHYHCDVCGKNFADSEGREEMESVKIPPQTEDPGTQQESNCVCGKRHEGTFSKIIIFIHKIIYFFKKLFNA